MFRTIRYLSIILMLVGASCSRNTKPGEKFNEPFSGSKYMSDLRHWRSTGTGSSSDLGIAKQKALLEARKNLASEVHTQMLAVSEQFQRQQEVGDQEIMGKTFQQLYREVLNTQLNDAVAADQKTFTRPNGQYVHYVAMQAHKRSLYRHMKRMNEASQSLSAEQKERINRMIDERIAEAEE
ncbi:MAG: hypothetical protein FJ344_05940 [Sphingomonadales bacterium]|nr:hypothetical protein [Sphingomonadales bacterium]